MLVVAAAGLALAAAGCGSDESHDGHDSSGSASSSASTGGAIDRAFAQAMIPHHESAVEMAEIAQERAQSQFVADLADDIIRTQR